MQPKNTSIRLRTNRGGRYYNCGDTTTELTDRVVRITVVKGNWTAYRIIQEDR